MTRPITLGVVAALALLLTVAVTRGAPPARPAPGLSSAKPSSPAAGTVRALPRDDSALPAPLWPPGERLDSLRWSDRNGLNLAVFTRSPAGAATLDDAEPYFWVYLHAKHYLQQQGRWRLVRWVKDRVQTCGLDLTAEVLTPSPVTDLDHDAIGELTFAFRLACRGDVSPAALKLFVLEDGAKYTLRGTTRVRLAPNERVGGEYRKDPAFKRADAALGAHAERIWAKIVQEQF